MKESILKTARILLFLLIGIFLLYIAFRDISIGELIVGLKSANYYWVALSLTFAFLAFLSRTYRWILLIEPLGYKPSPKNTFFALMTGYLANFIIPRIGEVARCGSLKSTEHIPADSLLGTVITERISDLIALLFLLVYIFFVNIGFFGHFIYNNILFPFYLRIASWLEFSVFIYALVFIFLLSLVLSYRVIAGYLRKFNVFRKIEKIAGGIISGMKSVMKLKKKFQYIIHTVFIWLMYYLMTWAIFMALPATAGLGGNAVMFILVIGGLGMAVPVQGGIGAYHWIVSVGLGLYGISREDGLVFATLSHESQALLMILLGSFSMFMVFRLSGKKSKPGGLLSPSTIKLPENG